MRRLPLRLLLLALAVGGPAVARASEEPGPLVLPATSGKLGFVKVGPVVEGPVPEHGGITGRVALDEDRTSRVATPVSGRVLQLMVQVGDRVKKGQPLFTVASPDVESARAEAIQAGADLQVAQRALERAQRLAAEGAVPKKELLQAQDDVTKAKSNVERTQARLDVLGLTRDTFASTYQVKAPIAGVVVERNVLQGQEVRADGGTPLVTLSDLGKLWLLVDVPERELSRAEVGDRATAQVSAWPGEGFSGKVTHVGEMVDPQTRTVKVRVALENADLRLKPEMYARVTLEEAVKHKALWIPSAAVVTDGEHARVWVATAPGRFEPRLVQVGAEHEGHSEIVSGLTAGQSVVIEGALFVDAEARN